ncbi:MAG: DUF2520 domain-containing protein [Acidobacteria bacterium]|nr:DUF2520 domain-containing protein [Acidobacteriota bacterium]
MEPRSITIIGAGRVGGAFALALARAGHRVDAVVARDRDFARDVGSSNLVDWSDNFAIGSDIVFIATRDAEIAAAASLVAERLNNSKPIVFHTSGALSSEILSELRDLGCSIGSLHPLVSISDPKTGAQSFSGAYFCLEGDGKAVAAGNEIVAALGGISFSVPTDSKSLYHASAVVACGHLVALVDVALEMLAACGLPEERAKEVLMPLIRSTVENLSKQKPQTALTGPFARADVDTVERHLAAFDGRTSEIAKEIYLDLAVRSLDLAAKNGIGGARADKLREMILLAKSDLKC